jgi:hypothetical protein
MCEGRRGGGGGGGGKRNKTRYEMKKLKDKNLEIKQCKSLR